MKLIIDTSKNDVTNVSLLKDSKKISKTNLRNRHSQVLLSLIESILLENSLTLKDITEIEVNTKLGSYTGIRVGLAVANTIGALLSIPVNGSLPGTPFNPQFPEEPYKKVKS